RAIAVASGDRGRAARRLPHHLNRATRDVPQPNRRSDYDVTDTVQVSSPAAVRRAIADLFRTAYPGQSAERLERTTDDLERLFGGSYPGYLGVDTVYHDLQHTLDVVLAMARLICGYEATHRNTAATLGPERAL